MEVESRLMSSNARELLQWVAEQMPALEARIADTHKLVERAREDGAQDDTAQAEREALRA